MYFSLFDTEDPRFVAGVKNFEDRGKCVNQAFDYATETNGAQEKADWIKAGSGKEGALNLMNFEIRSHEEPLPEREEVIREDIKKSVEVTNEGIIKPK